MTGKPAALYRRRDRQAAHRRKKLNKQVLNGKAVLQTKVLQHRLFSRLCNGFTGKSEKKGEVWRGTSCSLRSHRSDRYQGALLR